MLVPTSWIVLMSSSSAPSLGVVSVTMTLPGPWTVMVHLSPARSVPETILPALLRPGLLGLFGLIRLLCDDRLALVRDRVGHEQVARQIGRQITRNRDGEQLSALQNLRIGNSPAPDPFGPVGPLPCESHGRLHSPAARKGASNRRSLHSADRSDAPEAALPLIQMVIRLWIATQCDRCAKRFTEEPAGPSLDPRLHVGAAMYLRLSQSAARRRSPSDELERWGIQGIEESEGTD